MKKRLLLLLSALTLLTSCAAPPPNTEEAAMHLFYPADLTVARGGDAIESVAISPDEITGDDLCDQARDVVRRIMAGDQDHPSPLPAGTQLRTCELMGGIVHLDFSTAYSQLSGMELTMADYCLTLSLTELDDIYGVKITVMGEELDYRKSGILLAGNVLLTSTEDVVRELAVTLYFPDKLGTLKPEERLLVLYEGQSRAGVVVDALLSGPEREDLTALLPEGFAVASVRIEDRICYVNITAQSAALLPVEKPFRHTILTGLSRSIMSVEGIDSVQYLLDGQPSQLFE